eukprot:SAG22_NODE_7940_length_696_cov_1.125628_1_plen_69_part_10
MVLNGTGPSSHLRNLLDLLRKLGHRVLEVLAEADAGPEHAGGHDAEPVGGPPVRLDLIATVRCESSGTA